MKRKIFISFIVLILIGIFTTGALALSLLKTNYIHGIEEKLTTNANLITEFLNKEENFSIKYLNNIAKEYSERIDARITFVDKHGKVIGDSEADIYKLENHKNRPEIIKAYKGEIGISKRYSSSLDMDMLYVAVPFVKEGSDLAIVRLSVPLEEIDEFNKTLFKYFIVSAFTGILVALFLGIRYIDNITDPIIELTNATKRIAQGNYGERVYFNTDDEIGILYNNFNIMSKKLEETINELQDKNTKMKSILTSMVNGVIALDNSKKITFINPAAEEIFGFTESEVRGKHILEVVRNNVLDDLILNLLRDNVTSKGEIEIHEPKYRILNVYSNPITLENDPNRVIGVVIIIQDITEIRKLERMRKDFVANVSHELKTPLTSIKGFVETLKDGAAENKEIRDKFLDIIDIEAGRLSSLIQDLLLLSEIENKNTIEYKDLININKSVDEVLQVMNEIARQKDIELISNIQSNLPVIYGNTGWFKQMLINLIDNGIKYTPKGGKVTITAYTNSRNIYLKIKDTGIGIEKKHLSRLFERFYRVDKARSRQVGGTGLGLAIVKHIVLAFKGKIDVKSDVNKGTEFTIVLPIEK